MQPEMIDAEICALLGWRFWMEQRGETVLCVSRAPGKGEPWTGFQDQVKFRKERFIETTAVRAAQLGFWGRALPVYSSDPVASNTLVEEMVTEGFELHLYRNQHMWRCEFLRADGVTGQAQASTQPQTVALAAVAALRQRMAVGALTA